MCSLFIIYTVLKIWQSTLNEVLIFFEVVPTFFLFLIQFCALIHSIISLVDSSDGLRDENG